MGTWGKRSGAGVFKSPGPLSLELCQCPLHHRKGGHRSAGQRDYFRFAAEPGAKSKHHLRSRRPADAGWAPPTGTVSVWSNAWYLSYVGATLVNGVVNMTFPVNAGTYQVFAQYQGDSNYAITNSPSINSTVARITPPATLTASSSFVPSGQQFSLNFSVVGLNEGGGSYLAPSGRCSS